MKEVILIFYAIALLLGGLIGYIHAHSMHSLVMSTVFAIVLMISTLLMKRKKTLGIWVASVSILFLGVFFSYRFFSNHRFFPSGFFAILSLIALVMLLIPKRR